MARAVRFVGPHHVDIVPVPLAAPGPDSVVVRTAFSGISAGTELLAYRGEMDATMVMDERLDALTGTFRFPFFFGYSCFGTVEQGTAAISAGTPVFAFHPHQDRFVIADNQVVALDPSTDPRIATLFPLVETAFQIVLDAGPVAEETVVVTGLGPVGLLTSLLLRRAGARVLAGEPRGCRRDVAATLGIAAVPPAELPARVADLTGGRGVPLLIELSGTPAALVDGLVLLAHEGCALVGSWYGTKRVPLPLGEHFHRRRLTVRSSQVSTIPAVLRARWDLPRRRRTTRRLLDELPLRALATTEFAFEDAAEAFAAVNRGETGLLHAALRYE